ncbi:MAG: 2-C-methyl-D-erythritol 4-phosphate cytidylyltransferase [Nitrospirota bacterium]
MTAGGAGRRFGSALPKQFVPLAGVPLLEHTLRLFENHPAIDDMVLTLPAGECERRATDLQKRYPKLRRVMPGGASRQTSVYSALSEPMDPEGLVCIHDAVRPLVPAALLDALLAAADRDGAAAPALPVTETVAETDGDGWVVRHLERTALRTLQTPQVFHYHVILRAHEAAAAGALEYTDDTSIAAAAGCAVRLVSGLATNVKITTPADLALAAHWLARSEEVR